MPRKRRIAKTRTKLDVSPLLWVWLNDGECDSEVEFDVLLLECSHANAFSRGEDKLLTLWRTVRDELLEACTAQRPGTRPSLWWELDAPRQPAGGAHKGWWYDGQLQEPRKRLGGKGETPWDMGLAVVPWFRCGVPAYWETFDVNDPPVFESQATYLDRNGLLTAAEKRRLLKADFDPVIIGA
jgi:hypothetical protein